MSSSTTDFREQLQSKAEQSPLSPSYIPTEEEKRVLKQCNRESLLYRSLPFTLASVAVTKVLIRRGVLSASPKYGAVPKLVFASIFGYFAGKISYMKECQEKFKKLENSPLGEVLRQRTGPPHLNSNSPQSEFSDPDTQSFDPMFQTAEASGQMSTHTTDYDLPSQMGGADDLSAPAQSYVEEGGPRKKTVLYEDLRSKNRENYEVTLNQRVDTFLSTHPEKEPVRQKKDVKKNIYGDTWEE